MKTDIQGECWNIEIECSVRTSLWGVICLQVSYSPISIQDVSGGLTFSPPPPTFPSSQIHLAFLKESMLYFVSSSSDVLMTAEWCLCNCHSWLGVKNQWSVISGQMSAGWNQTHCGIHVFVLKGWRGNKMESVIAILSVISFVHTSTSFLSAITN